MQGPTRRDPLQARRFARGKKPRAVRYSPEFTVEVAGGKYEMSVLDPSGGWKVRCCHACARPPPLTDSVPRPTGPEAMGFGKEFRFIMMWRTI